MCHTGNDQFYGAAWARTDLYSNHGILLSKTRPLPHGEQQYRPDGNGFYGFCGFKRKWRHLGFQPADRSKTVKHLIDEQAKPEDFIRPGHVFPLTAKEGEVLRRTGHTEAAIEFARLAGFKPAGVIVEIMNSDGTMARLPELRVIADELQLKLVSIESLVAYRMKFDSLVEKVEDYPLETKYGTFQLQAFKQNTNQQIHIALTKGNWSENDKVLTRIQSLNMTQNILNLYKEMTKTRWITYLNN